MSQSLKVAYLLGSLNRGGTETLIFDVLNQSKNSNIKMIAIYRHEGDMSSSFLNTGSSFFKLSFNPLWKLGFYLIRLRQLFKKNQVTIIHSHQSIDTILGVIASVGLGIKFVQTIHCFDFETNRFGKVMKQISFLLAHKTIFVSQTQKKYYVAKYYIKSKNVAVVYNGIDLGKFYNKRIIELKKEMNIDNSVFLMGMVGNFSPGRDHLTVCRFLSLLKNSGFNFLFLFIGGKHPVHPELLENCVSFCERNGLMNKILFYGKRQDVPDLLPQMDVFIFSTNYDAFGNSVIEAMASGIPVLVNDWEVMREITENGEKAILYESKSEYDLFRKFTNFYSESAKYKEKAICNMEWVKQNYSIQKHLDRLKQIYNKA